MSQDVFARLAAAKKEEKAVAPAKVAQATSAVNEKSFEITEATIKSNPVYSIITDPKLSDQKKIDALHELKRYKSELTQAQNQANQEASNEFLLYVENQLMASSQKGIEFTNDNAFALYDETIRELFDNIKTFKGYIEPFVKALEVLQKARDAGIPANQLIEAVSEMQEEINTLQADKTAKEEQLKQLEDALQGYNTEATRTAARLEEINSAITTAQAEKTEAEKSWNILSKGKLIENAQSTLTRLESQLSTLTNTAKVNADNLDRHAASIETLKAEISSIDLNISEKEAEFSANEDSQAIATLIEITGADFKAKRQEVVTAAQTITVKAITGIENSIGRFDSGRQETGTQLNTVTNLNSMVGLVSSADRQVRKSDATFISEQQEIVDRIKAECNENGTDPRHNPDYQSAKEHLDAANNHVADVIASSTRASDLEGKLTRQTGTFKGLRDAYAQKGQDATRLRTSAAVEIPAQLAVTVKSVEMATATESNNMVNDAFADLSRTTQASVSSIFDTVSAGAGQNNEQLRRTLESTLATIDMMNAVQADLQAKAREGYQVRQALEESQRALQDVTGTVASAAVDAEHSEMGSKPLPTPKP